MKRKVIALGVVFALALAMMTGCSNNSQPAAGTASQANVAESYVTTVPETTKPVTLDDVAQEFIGWALDDVAKAFSDAKKSNLYSYESDNGKSIIVKNNWAVDSYRIEDGKIVFVCTKFRNDGLVDAAIENADAISAASSIIKMLS